jgi:hypothetical protein
VKSGKKGFYPNHEAQLQMYSTMWTENFPHMPPQALFNWAPADWETEPSYHLKDQSGSKYQDVIQDYIHIYNRLYNKSEDKYPFISGTIEYGKLNGNLQLETFREHMTRLGQLKGMQHIEPVVDEGFNVAPPVEEKPAKKKAKSNVIILPVDGIKDTDQIKIEVQANPEPKVKLHSISIDGKNVEFDEKTGEVIGEQIPDETPIEITESDPNIYTMPEMQIQTNGTGDDSLDSLENLLNNYKGKTA